MRRWVAVLLVLGLVAVAAGVAIGEGIRHREDTTASTEPKVSEPSGAPSSAPSSAGPSTGTDHSVTKPPDPRLARFYHQQLDWASCGDDQCATLTVPLDYDRPDGETIGLALLKRQAGDPDERVGSLVVNPGGPGAPGTSYAQAAETAFRKPLLDRYDIVGFDPRGTGSSDPVDCLDDSQLDAWIAGDPEPSTVAQARRFMNGVRAFAQGCRERSGSLIDHVSTEETARDMDVLRAALGEAKLDYLGASYGTKLGATYAEEFPHRVGRMVLDGALPPGLSTQELSVEQAQGFQTALDSYVRDCVDGGDCFLGDSVAEGTARISQFLDDVEASPLPTSSGRELTVGNAFYGIVTPLYNRDYWSLLTKGLQDGFDGDGSTLMLLSDAYTSRSPTGDGYLDNAIEANLVINCLDDPWSIPATRVPRKIPAFERASEVFGNVFAWGLTSCRGFDRAPVAQKPVSAKGAPPILVLGTTRDPATPLRWAEQLASDLTSGVLVTRDGDGHTAYNSGNACIDTSVEDYLLDGTVPQDGKAC